MTDPVNVDLIARLEELDVEEVGERIVDFARAAYPICRSITGDGVRQTLAMVSELLPELDVVEVESGSQVFDWQVPPEWNVREAWIADGSGQRVVDFADHNLHLLSYSEPIDRTMSLAELDEHLHSDPDRPEAIPYRTSYYQRTWGFCLSHRQRQQLEDGDYRVVIDSTLEPGHLTYGELALAGDCDETVLVSTHVCHPSMCNDNLSGIGVCAQLARLLADLPRRRYSYRFLFIPGTIGSITWLARNEQAASRVVHGLVAANLGDDGLFHYKRSRRGDAVIDRAVEQVLADAGAPYDIEPFMPFGYDERQYASPGFDLPVGLLSRTPWGQYPEYHSSDDNLKLVSARRLGESLLRYLQVVEVLENDRVYLNTNPKCEPQLGRRGLYSHIGGGEAGRERQLALLWVLNLSDGEHSLLDVAQRSGMSFRAIVGASRALIEVELLRAADDPG